MSVAERTTGFEVTTPSGIGVYFQSAPKREYRVRDERETNVRGMWQAVPSVTEVLKVLEKGGLSWWGQGVGVSGVLQLIRDGKIGKEIPGGDAIVRSPEHGYVPATQENVTELLKAYKLTVNHTLTKAGDRGTSVHRALEKWGEDRTLPNAEFYPEEERGYIVGLCKFLTDLNLAARPKLEMETMVGSVQHGYAGRYDMAVTIAESELVTNVTPVRGETREVFPKGRILADLKTSKSTYDTHHLQLAAYDLAAQECGYPKSSYQMVVRVGADGNYAVTRNRATSQDFLAVKGAYDALSSLKGRK